VIAILIDGFVFGAFYTLLKDFIIPDPFFDLGIISYLILFLPLFCKDMLFRNASLGKKIMGISIFDRNWKKPSFPLLFKRAFLTLTVGYMICCKSIFVEKNDSIGYVKKLLAFFQGSSFLHIYYTIKSKKNQDLYF